MAYADPRRNNPTGNQAWADQEKAAGRDFSAKTDLGDIAGYHKEFGLGRGTGVEQQWNFHYKQGDAPAAPGGAGGGGSSGGGGGGIIGIGGGGAAGGADASGGGSGSGGGSASASAMMAGLQAAAPEAEGYINSQAPGLRQGLGNRIFPDGSAPLAGLQRRAY